MSRIFLIGCLHFGHVNMARNRGFSDVDEHDDYIIKEWNKVVKKRDTVWILGDITMEKKEHYHKLKKLNGIKNVVLGNHDLPQHVPDLLKYVNKVAGVVDFRDGIVLSHIPIHPRELYWKRGNIHAHIHSAVISDSRYQNVCVENVNYVPQLYDDVLKRITSFYLDNKI